MKAKITWHNGSPELNINDKKYSPISYRSFQPQPDIVKKFYDKGYEFFHLFPSGLLCTLGTPYSNSGEVWEGEDKYNWDNLRNHINMFLKSAPNAKFALIIHLDTRDWYLEQNPEAISSFTNLVSMCQDEKWRKSASKFLKNIIEFVEREYPDRVYAAHLFAGHSTEWYSHCIEGIGPETDSLIESYKKQFGADAKLPSHKECFDIDNGVFRHPAKNKKAVDFWKFYGEIIADTIEYFAKQVKEITNGRMLTGCFYGYTMCFAHAYARGHGAYWSLLNNPYIDMILAPSAYKPFRGMDSMNAFNLAVDSIKLHNKLYMHEIDNVTSITVGNEMADRISGMHQRPETLADSITCCYRDAARAVEHGGGYWWFDMWNGWFEHPELMDAMEKMKKATEEIYKVGAESVSEIAAFVDADSGLYLVDEKVYGGSVESSTGKGAIAVHYDTVYKQQDGLGRIGAPVSYYDVNDVMHPKFPHEKTKLYIFLNLYAPTDEMKKTIAKLREEGKSILYLYAPGYIGKEDYSLENMKELTGFEFEIANETLGEISTSDGIKWGGDRGTSPLFTVKEDGCDVLARYTQSGHAGAVMKQRGASIDAWVGCGPVPGKVLREIAEKAGVFIWHDGDDPVYINEGMLGMYSFEGGEKEINLPENTLLVNAFVDTEKLLPENGKILLEFKPKEFKLFINRNK